MSRAMGLTTGAERVLTLTGFARIANVHESIAKPLPSLNCAHLRERRQSNCQCSWQLSRSICWGS